MICYNCGCRLSEHDFCTACGADVAVYKKVMHIANRYYNDGLEKAQVRDLTGAITSLRQSLKFNKNHIEARNLLGLVYFEMGEVVAALSEWVISKNLRSKKNIADDYINMVQSNTSRLDSINQTIKKYNQALLYCRQQSLDLAVIQLKKVLSLNPKFVRAHQLLALLYINSEEWERARRELYKCSQIDTNNTITMRYLKEVEQMLSPEDGAKTSAKKKNKAEDVIKYQSGNETIIQPMNKRESKGVSTVVNMAIGILVGLAAAWFLILPARIQAAKALSDDELRTVSEQLDAKTATIGELEQQVKTLTETNQSLQADLDNYVGTDGALQAMDKLLSAANAYVTNEGEVMKVAESLDEIDLEELGESVSDDFRALYEKLTALVGPELAKAYYEEGYELYRQEQYAAALPILLKACQYDESNGDALYYLAHCYRLTENNAKAAEAYGKVVELFPGTEKARNSKRFLTELENADASTAVR